MKQRKRENSRRNVFMTKFPRKNGPDMEIELGAACMPSKHASDRATAPGPLEGIELTVEYNNVHVRIPGVGQIDYQSITSHNS